MKKEDYKIKITIEYPDKPPSIVETQEVVIMYKCVDDEGDECIEAEISCTKDFLLASDKILQEAYQTMVPVAKGELQ